MIHKIISHQLLQWIFFAALALLAFYPIFSFWFYRGWETSWLLGITGGDFSLLNLMKSHGVISYMNYLLFGWRPTGWFVTALIFHVITAMVVNQFISRKTNKIIGLVAGLLFLITTAHHDVVTWGSFESLYAVQTLCFYLGLWCFDTYRNTKQSVWYGIMVFWFVLSLIIRESGLIFLPLVFLFDMMFHERIYKKKPSAWIRSILPIVARHMALWAAGGIYLLVRSSYGGAGHDFIDERVQFRILLFHEHRYVEYIRYGLLSFGYFIGPYVIPYPLLNLIRDIVLHYVPNPFIKTYFFTFVGWILYVIFCYVTYRVRKQRYGTYLLFCLFSFTAVTLFYSFAWTVKDSFLGSEYSWSENRWRYLGFTFFAAGMSIICYHFFATVRKLHKIPIVLLGVYLVINIVLLYRIQEQMYRQNSLPAVIFYRTFLKTFPTLTSEDRFYAFRASPGLNDFLAELSYIYPTYYPNIGKLPSLWVRTEMHYILKGLSEGAPWSSRVRFIDYTVDSGVRDHTQKAKAMRASLGPLDLVFRTGSDSAIIADAAIAHPAEFRYVVTVQYQASATGTTGMIKDARQMQALSAFSKSLTSLVSDKRVSVCQTMGDEKEPYYDLRKELAIDANIGIRSFWWANCRPAWIVLDMGRETTFAGAAWASVTHSDAVPRDYRYDISDDGVSWKPIHEVKRNEKNSVIDVFSKPTGGRYIRLWVNETSYRQMVRVDEFLPLTPETVRIAQYYRRLPELYDDMYREVIPAAWLKVTWNTKPDNTVPVVDTTMYVPIVADNVKREVRIELPESDFYSAQGQFLNRRLTNIILLPPETVSFRVSRLRLEPLETYRAL